MKLIATHHSSHLKRIIYERKVHILPVLLVCMHNEKGHEYKRGQQIYLALS